MKKTNINRNMRGMLVVFVLLFFLLGSYLLYSTVVYGEKWFSSPFNPRISSIKNIANAGAIYDRKGILLAWSEGDERHYAKDSDMRRAVSHIVGDVYGKSMGAETYFAKYLYGYDQGVLDKLMSAAQGNKKGGDVFLTIDAGLCEFIYHRMDYDGAVVMMNYETGEILASVSVPNFDPEAIGNGGEEDDGTQYLNRVTQGRYPPGSTMKIITAAAALENGRTHLQLHCTGGEAIAGQNITCPAQGGHGQVDFQSAFEKSCNVYYAQLAVDLGRTNMERTAERCGFNYEFMFPNFSMLASHFITGENDGDLAWAGIGQYKDLVTPMHNMLIAAAIANDGVMMRPNTLLDVRYGGNSGYTYMPASFRTIMSESVADDLIELMRGTVEQGTATSADISAVPICGKTGTAEFVKDGEIKNHSWFVGFSQDRTHPVAIAVILEGAGYGSAYATPLAGEALTRAIEMGY
jgi:peptidoglycan glycosyltransferase